MNARYCVVTPVKNEEQYFPKTVESMITQTLLPDKWIIIDDGSTDRTGDILHELEAAYPWIRTVTNPAKHDRAPGGEGVLHLGIQLLTIDTYDYFVRIDGDISFAPDFFATLFCEFEKNPKLGIGSGVCYNMTHKGPVEEWHPQFHTRGATKVYRVACYQSIGGLQNSLGWDGMDEIKANMLGWQTYSLPQLHVLHYRKTQSANGVLNGKINLGKAAYYLGYHPLFLLLRAVRHMAKAPYLVGGASLLAGYVKAYLSRQPQVKDPALIAYVRDQQLRRLTGRETIWR